MKKYFLVAMTLTLSCAKPSFAQTPALPPTNELDAPFGELDGTRFRKPSAVYSPQTWFHFIGGNVSKAGITADLEAIAAAGISGIQLFHGQFGGAWPKVNEQISCLSPLWDDAVKHTAEECRRLGLRFTMQNCPGWAMAGGPWIEPKNAMRHLVWSRTDVEGGRQTDMPLPHPQPDGEDWRDYHEVAVIAFPTPEGDSGKPMKPASVRGDATLEWESFMSDKDNKPIMLKPVGEGNAHWLEITLPEPAMLRTVEFSSINGFNHNWCAEPGVKVWAEAILPDGRKEEIMRVDMPAGSWQDDKPVSLACNETSRKVSTYKIYIENRHDMQLYSLRLYSAARKNNWEAEAGWTLRSIERKAEHPRQSASTFVRPSQIIDITASMDNKGQLRYAFPAGQWTVLRIGNVNTGQKNSPAPPEGTGWECDKLSEAGANAHFAGYIGRLATKGGALDGGMLNGMLLDSWECKTQTWTEAVGMEDEFAAMAGYPLRLWLPAVFGYVVGDHDVSARFLRDWRGVIGRLFADKFYGRMAQLAHENGMTVAYETAAGDIFPADVMEYYKHADVPMCEFWHPRGDNYVGSLNFKPIKPTASAARMYGKPRVAAEAFTSFALTWDEHWSMLRETANANIVEGVTHFVFHTYTHNPQIGFLPPGTSFGSSIGTPFLRGQTWWRFMPEFTSCLARCTYLLERGKPVSDVLWYLGDEINHKPDQNAPFPDGFKYDYCNPDVLLNRLSVSNGRLVTPEGITYRLLWMPDNERMLPETVAKLLELAQNGAVIVGNAPKSIATLSGGTVAQQRFEDAVHELWGDRRGVARRVGAGMVLACPLKEALDVLKLEPDVTGGKAPWLHRRTDGADWYFVCAPQDGSFKGTLSFNQTGTAEIWEPVSGDILPARSVTKNNRTTVALDLPNAASCFVVFRHEEEAQQPGATSREKPSPARTIPLNTPWTLSFPAGWGAPPSLKTKTLKAWKDLDVSTEAKAFSGTVAYETEFNAGKIKAGDKLTLDLGRVEMIASVTVNGKPVRTLWTPPYTLDLTGSIRSGRNVLKIEVTGTWFNRLVYDAAQPEAKRKTWTIAAPAKDEPLRESGLLGPVVLRVGGE
ncbi:MAG: hypothetical protein LBH04_01165 [Tannerellaceae bacterium]|jgi:hypothetical protein|nr:hypothetical protein [Tannerellaceae bacterium]